MNEQQRPVAVTIDRSSARDLMVTALIVWAAFLALRWLFDVTHVFLFEVVLAWLIAIAMEPPITLLVRRGMKRGLAAGLVLLAIVVAIVGFFGIFGSLFFGQLASAVSALPAVVDSTISWANATFDLKLDAADIIDQLNLTTTNVASMATSIAGGVVGLFSGVVSALFKTLTILMFAFYLAAESPAVKRTVSSWLKPSKQHVFLKVWDIAVAKTGGFVVSRVVLAALSAAAHITFFWAVDVPYWMPMGIFAGVTSQFIPTLGTYIGILVPAAFAAMEAPLTVVWIVVFATIYQQIENYVLGPRISRATMDMHPAIALAAVFVGTSMMGAVGAIIGIPLAAAVLALVDTYGHRYELVAELKPKDGDRR